MRSTYAIFFLVSILFFLHTRDKKETFIDTLKWKQPSLKFEHDQPLSLNNPLKTYLYRPGFFTSYLRSEISRYLTPILSEINSYFKLHYRLGKLLLVKQIFFSQAKEYTIQAEVIDLSENTTQIIEMNLVVFNFCGKYHINYIHFPQTPNTLTESPNIFSDSKIVFSGIKQKTLSLLTPKIQPKIYPDTSIEKRFDHFMMDSLRYVYSTLMSIC